jgi:hypothetical protein
MSFLTLSLPKEAANFYYRNENRVRQGLIEKRCRRRRGESSPRRGIG